MEPLVSVIIPNYNHAKFLKQRFDSVLKQTYQKFEIIVLDDKSNDDSIDIIKQYEGNEHISHIVFNDKNCGSPFKQWQKGFDLAKGELIWIAESDDACEDSLLELLVNEFHDDPKCVVAFCKSITINSDGQMIGEKGMGGSFHMDGLSFIEKYLYRYCYISNASSAIFKNDTLKEVDSRFTSFRGSGDWLFWIEISKCGNVAYLDRPLNFFRIHDLNTTSKELRSGNNEMEAIAIYRFMQEKKYVGYKELLRERIAHIYSIRYGKLHGIFDSKKKNELLKGWKENIFIRIIVFGISVFQKYFGYSIIKR